MDIPCAASRADRAQQSSVDSYDSWDSWLGKRIAELMAADGECYPFGQLNAATALESVPYFVAAPIFRHYAKAAADTNRESREAHLIRAGEEFIAMLRNYWTVHAKAQAEKEIK